MNLDKMTKSEVLEYVNNANTGFIKYNNIYTFYLIVYIWGNTMDKLNNIDKRLTKLEKKLHISNKNRKRTDEGIASLIAKVAPTVIKNLPLILEVLGELKELFKDDTDKANALDAIINELPKKKD